ncbi:MAG: methyltransferase [Candidatus Sericytochromatia bacterium]|nr:methyltransferase [Candidatus Sericytochromatia bacterium]
MSRVEHLLPLGAWGMFLGLALKGWVQSPGVAPALLVLFHGLVLWLLARRPGPRARGHAFGTLPAVLGTCLPLAFRPSMPGEGWWPPTPWILATGAMVQVVALILMLASAWSLGHCFGIRPACRGLVTQGPYAVIRHPLYLAEVMCAGGLWLVHPTVRNSLVLVVLGLLLALRARLEEEVLGEHPGWENYRRKVPALPGAPTYRSVP